MTHLTGQDLQDKQFDILWELLDSNPQLPFSPVKNLNKQLNTNGKNVIKAINELLERAVQNDTSILNFNERFNELMGDAYTNPVLFDNLKKIDSNVLKSVYKIYLEIVGDPNKPTDISQIAPSVKDAILELNDNLIGLAGRVDSINSELALAKSRTDATTNDKFRPREFESLVGRLLEIEGQLDGEVGGLWRTNDQLWDFVGERNTATNGRIDEVYGIIYGDEIMGNIENEKTRAKAAEEELSDRIDSIPAGSGSPSIKTDAFVIDTDSTHIFVLKKPTDGVNVSFYINGIRYIRDIHFTVDKATNKVTWIFTKAQDGFDIRPGMIVEIAYSLAA